jgi:hypothetical protein
VSQFRKSLPVRVFAAGAGAGLAVLALPVTAQAAAAEPALVHASASNGCKLNVRAGTDLTAPVVTTLTCVNYTTCVHAEAGQPPCGPYVTGGKYTCVSAQNTSVTDDRWAEVAWRSPQTSYIAVGCAAFRN